MATFNLFNQFKQDLARKVHDLGADSLKIMLTNTAPVATNAVKTDITEIAAGGGYVAGGFALTINSATQTAGVFTLKIADATLFTASAAVATYRYAVIYNDTPTAPADPLIGWADLGSARTLAAGDPCNLDITDATGILLTW